MWLPVSCGDRLGPSVNAIALLTRSFVPSLGNANLRMKAALQLVGACPAARTLLLVRGGRPGAGNAPDRAVAGLVQRVVGDLVDLDVGPHALLVPVGERMQLPDAV